MDRSRCEDVILSARQVAYLIARRDELPRKVFLSIRGPITALSNIIRKKDCPMFFIEVDKCIVILVKDFHLDWYMDLEPRGLYVFYNLRLTTMEKGASRSCTLLFAWKTSSVEKLMNESSVSTASLQEWLKEKNILGISYDEQTSQNEEEDDQEGNVLTYQGTVTSTAQALDGIFVLDHKLRLFVGPISSSDNVALLKLHRQVSVHNGHFSKIMGHHYLVCCVRTCIKASQPISDNCDATSSTDTDQMSVKGDGDLLHTLMKYRLNLKEVVTVLQLRDKLANLGSPRNHLTGLISQYLRSSQMISMTENPTDSFIHHNENCSFIRSKSEMCRLPQVLDISSLKAEVESQIFAHMSEGCHKDKNAYGGKSIPSTQPLTINMDKNKILVGRITAPSGQTVFRDDTGSLPVLILPGGSDCVPETDSCTQDWEDITFSCTTSSADQSLPHSCTQCCVSQPGMYPLCPVLDPAMMGEIVCVRRCQIVVESYHTIKTSEFGSCDDTSCDGYTYLVLAVQDCVFLQQMVRKPVFDSCSSLSSHGRPSVSSSKKEQGETNRFKYETKNYVFVTEKQALTSSTNFLSKEEYFQFRIQGSQLTYEPSSISDCDSDTCNHIYGKKCGSSDVKYSQGAFAQCTKNDSCSDVNNKKYDDKMDQEDDASPNKKCKLQNGAACSSATNTCASYQLDSRCAQGNTEIGATSRGVLDKKNAKSMEKGISVPGSTIVKTLRDTSSPVCIMFSNSACQWYSFITPGQLYKLSVPQGSGSEDAFRPVFSNAQLQKAAEHYNVRMDIVVPEDVLIERLPPLPLTVSTYYSDIQEMQSIHDIISESFSDSLVSFQGVIVSRNSTDMPLSASSSEKHGIQRMFADMKLSMTNMKLEVRELNSNSDDNLAVGAGIVVYIDAPKAVYSLGLIPGALVNFHKLERKVSRYRNIYCRFTAISRVEVVRMSKLDDLDWSQRSVKRAVKMTDLPRELLINIWQHSVEDGLMWCIHCHISMFFRLSIKLICSVCKGTVLKHQCQSRGCGSSSPPTLSAQAVLLVEDGTSQASVKVWDSDLVRHLLTLTEEQWEDVISAVSGDGEVLISKFNQSSSWSSPIAGFLDALAGSSMILRPCEMAVRMSRNSPSFQSVDMMHIKDFEEKEIKIGKAKLKTLSLPLMQLDCLAFAERD